MKNNNWGITIIVAVVVAAVAFFGGMKYQQTQVASTSNGGQFAQGGQGGQGARTGQAGQGTARFGGRGGGATVGQVVSQDANSITVKLQDGSSKIVNISGTTTYSKTSTASASDVTVGSTIAAIGTTNSDGSVTAQNIQLNPSFNRAGGFGGGMMRRPSPAQ
jgi:hypothetical protein